MLLTPHARLYNTTSSSSIENVYEQSRHTDKSALKYRTQSNKREEHHGYVVPVSYSGQKGAGIQAFISLQCWVSSFSLPIHLLEPVMLNTMFYSILPSSQNTSDSVISLIFTTLIEYISESLGYPIVVTRKDFFSATQREAILMMKTHNGTPASVIWAADSGPDGKRNCYQFVHEAREIMRLTKEVGFCLVRIIQAPYYDVKHWSLSDKEFRNFMFGDILPEHTTLILSHWSTQWYSVNDLLENPTKCRGVGKKSNKEQFLPSPRLISDAQYYEAHFLNTSNNVALMLCVERMIEFVREHNHPASIGADECLDEAIRVTRSEQGSGYPMTTLDLGMFGSSSLPQFLGKDMEPLTRKSKMLLTDLYDNKLTFDECEMSFTKATGGVENSGYIAALQRTLASRAKCLVLVGGGSFHDLALKDYLKNHPNKEDQCIHLVCTVNERQLSEVIKANS